MKTMVRKALAVTICLVICMALRMDAFAADTGQSYYQEILNEINNEFNLDLGFVPVDKDKVSLDEYRETAYRFAYEQRTLLDYLENGENDMGMLSQPGSVTPSTVPSITSSSVVKTKTKSTWELGERFTITATYTVFNGNSIGLCRNARLNSTSIAIATNTYLTNISGPTYSVIDKGRTSTVRYTATVHFNSLYGFSNTVLYTEFYYNE